MARRIRDGDPTESYRTIKVAMPPLADEDFQSLLRLRRDSGFLWSSLVTYHRMIRREGHPWPTLVELAKEMTGMTAELGLSLCTQSQNLLFDEFLGSVETASSSRRTARERGEASDARYPWPQRPSRDVHWDRTKSVRAVPGGFLLTLAMVKDETNCSGLRRQRSLFVPYRHPIPKNCVTITIHYAVDDRRFYLLFKVRERTGKRIDVPREPRRMAIDLGQIRKAACMTESGESLNVKGRGLRSLQQGAVKTQAFRRSRIDRKRRGSKNRRKEVRKLARASRRARWQARNFLHTVSRRVVDFATKAGVTEIFIGDPHGVRASNVGRRQNQANHLWLSGQVTRQIEYKAKESGIATYTIDERGTTRSCPVPGCDGRTKPKGRVYRCPHCGFTGHRDAVGSWNTLMKGCDHTHGPRPEFRADAMSLESQKYLTPVGVRGCRRSPVPRNPFRVASSAEQPRSGAAWHPKHVTRGRAPVDGMEQAGPRPDIPNPRSSHQGVSWF